jgi:hypothetical protein
MKNNDSNRITNNDFDWTPRTPLEKRLMFISSFMALTIGAVIFVFLENKYEMIGSAYFYEKPVFVLVALALAFSLFFVSIKRILAYKLYRRFYSKD